MCVTHEGCWVAGLLGGGRFQLNIKSRGWRHPYPNCLIFKQMLMSTATQKHLNSNLKMLSLHAKSKDMFVVLYCALLPPSFSVSLFLRFSVYLFCPDSPVLSIKAFLSHAYLMSHAFPVIFFPRVSPLLNVAHIFQLKVFNSFQDSLGKPLNASALLQPLFRNCIEHFFY